MSRARDQRRQMRLALHKDRAVPALYIRAGASPQPCTVRVWTSKPVDVGTLAGNRELSHSAAMAEVEPKLIFHVSEFPTGWQPRTGAIVSVELGEAYRIGLADPTDDTEIVARVMRVPASEATGLPLPA